MQRRSFLKNAGLGTLAGGAAVATPMFAQDAPTLSWRMASSFGRHLDTLFGTGEVFCKYVTEVTGGRITIRHFPAGEIVPALEVLDAVSRRKVELGHTVSHYYFGKNPLLCFDATVPFGLNARQMNAWMLHGDGTKLTREVFQPYQIVNFPMGNTGVQMGGWYRKEIKRPADLKGLTMRTAGIAGEVLSRLGVIPRQMGSAEIYSSLEKGTLDAAEYVGPYDDERLGFNKVAKFYYYPGWWEVGTQASLYVNSAVWADLPKSYQATIEAASRAAHINMTARYDSQNPAALRRLLATGTQLRSFPRSVMDAAWDAANTVYAEFSAKDPKFKALYENYMGYRDTLVPWFRLAEGNYDQYLSAALARGR